MDQRVYEAAMSDMAVVAKTGKTWDQWFRALDRADAPKLGHKGIVKLLDKLGIGPWWRQMVTVEYERARGLRLRNQTATGFSVSISRTMDAERAALYRAATDSRKRRKWFPAGLLKKVSATENKCVRARWNGDARLEINFYGKPGGRAQIVVQVSRLENQDDVERERALWKKALVKLEAIS